MLCCIHGSLQPVENAELISDKTLPEADEPGGQQPAGLSAKPDYHRQHRQPASTVNGSRTCDDGSQLRPAARVEQSAVHGTEVSENVPRFGSDEPKYPPASSHQQIFTASISQQHPATLFPDSAALDACFGSSEKQLELPSMTKSVDETSLCLPYPAPKTAETSGCKTAEMDPESFLRVVNLLLCFRFMVEKFAIHHVWFITTFTFDLLLRSLFSVRTNLRCLILTKCDTILTFISACLFVDPFIWLH